MDHNIQKFEFFKIENLPHLKNKVFKNSLFDDFSPTGTSKKKLSNNTKQNLKRGEQTSSFFTKAYGESSQKSTS